MIATERFGDVTRFTLSSPRTRLVGLSVSVYLVRGMLVDCGFPNAADEILPLLRGAKGLAITHKHEDHAGNVELAAARGIPLWLSAGTRKAVTDPASIGFYRRSTWGVPAPLRSPVAPFDVEPLQAIPTPGHSADHHVFWDAETQTVFGGDLFLGVKLRVAHPREDIRGAVTSLNRIAALDVKRFFDGHRGHVPDPAAMLRAKAGWLTDQIGEIERLIRAGSSEDRVFQIVMGRESWTGYISRGDYSRLNFVRAIIDTMPDAPRSPAPTAG